MIDALTTIGGAFLAGLFAPLGAVCVLPIYPGFLAYLASQLKENSSQKKTLLLLGVIVTVGVIVSMMLIGLIFTFLLQTSLTKAIGIISPIAFGVLLVISLLMIFNVNIATILPKMQAPMSNSPYKTSFLFGFFFGAVVLPCNPASLVVLFALSTTATDVLTNFVSFVVFGFGMGLPLLLLSLLSAQGGQGVVNFLTSHAKSINRIAGLIMLAVSLYYLIFVFNLFG